LTLPFFVVETGPIALALPRETLARLEGQCRDPVSARSRRAPTSRRGYAILGELHAKGVDLYPATTRRRSTIVAGPHHESHNDQ